MAAAVHERGERAVVPRPDLQGAGLPRAHHPAAQVQRIPPKNAYTAACCSRASSTHSSISTGFIYLCLPSHTSSARSMCPSTEPARGRAPPHAPPDGQPYTCTSPPRQSNRAAVAAVASDRPSRYTCVVVQGQPRLRVRLLHGRAVEGEHRLLRITRLLPLQVPPHTEAP